MASFNHPGVFFGAVVDPANPFSATLPLTLTSVVLEKAPGPGRSLLMAQVLFLFLSLPLALRAMV